MSLENVQQALISVFVAGFPDWQAARVAWENKAFTPPIALPWFKFYFMPVDERLATLGPTGFDEANGLLQIDLNVPIGGGEGVSRETINSLRACFRPQEIAYGGQPVTILSRSRAGGMTSNGFYKIPFTVRWRAQIKRNP